MSEHEQIPEELKALEASLMGLAPVPVTLDERALFYRAGQASARRGLWVWQSLAAAGLVLAAGLGMTRTSLDRERIVVVEVPKAAPANPSPEVAPVPRPVADLATGQLAQGSYLHLRQRWVTVPEETDDWLPPPTAPGPPRRSSPAEWLN